MLSRLKVAIREVGVPVPNSRDPESVSAELTIWDDYASERENEYVL